MAPRGCPRAVTARRPKKLEVSAKVRAVAILVATVAVAPDGRLGRRWGTHKPPRGSVTVHSQRAGPRSGAARPVRSSTRARPARSAIPQQRRLSADSFNSPAVGTTAPARSRSDRRRLIFQNYLVCIAQPAPAIVVTVVVGSTVRSAIYISPTARLPSNGDVLRCERR